METNFVRLFATAAFVICMVMTMAQRVGAESTGPQSRPKGPCDVYAAAGDPCVAAHSTTRALYASFTGALYQVLRQSDGKTLDVEVVQPAGADAGGYANAAAQDAFCANTYCWISKIYDQSGKHNDLTQAPRGGFSGPALGGLNNLPIADMAPVTIMGHKVYGVFIEPGMGLRQNDAHGTAVDDQAEGQYWVINGLHFNDGCCFDYGNAEIDSRDDDNGTMETAYFGDAPWWYHGNLPGPWVMTDQENNLVGCVNQDGTNDCPNLPNITWRFVTAVAKGEPHHWTSMGGDAQHGALQGMFDGPRVNATYDPMRKQGAILLGNGGDNSNGSQGTFYEGAVTAAGTFPTDATDQLVQANVVAAHYGPQALSLAPASATAEPPGLQIFTPGSSQDTTVTFRNATEAPAVGVKLSITTPNKQWTAVVAGTSEVSKTFAEPVAPGASVSATFRITAGAAAFNGDLTAKAAWKNQGAGATHFETAIEKVRNASPVKINEFRISSGSNTTASFVELYNAGSASVDVSNWTLTIHPTQQAIFSAVKIPPDTRLGQKGFYLVGLSNSGLAVPAKSGDSAIFLRNTTSLKPADTLIVGDGPDAENHRIASVGSAASNHTTVWQPVPDGPVITFPAGSTNIPVMSSSGFAVGEKIALGFGATYPAVARDVERCEIATITAVGKPGTQAYLAADASSGESNIKVTSVSDISVGDKIRLDIDSVGHGVETVTVAKVGSSAIHTNLSAKADAGAKNIKVRGGRGFAVGDKIFVGTPASREEVSITAVGNSSAESASLEFTPALVRSHIRDEGVVSPGTGLDLQSPLKFAHAANLPFSDRGTGISFQPATAHAHSSNEPVQALGSGITLDRPLEHSHPIFDAVRSTAVKDAGYQDEPAPNQWFGGPELITNSPQFGRTIPVRQGSLVLRDASGLVVDSLNYGGLVDPWAGEGYQAASGRGKSGCYAPAPGPAANFGPPSTAAINTSAGRFPDGADTVSSCADFNTQAATDLLAPSAAGAANLKVGSVSGFEAGQRIMIGTGTDQEIAVIATVGTAGATELKMDTAAGVTEIPVSDLRGFREGQTVLIDTDANQETATIVSIRRFGGAAITIGAPLAHSHAAGVQVSGSGITLSQGLTREHGRGSVVADHFPTPGAPNKLR